MDGKLYSENMILMPALIPLLLAVGAIALLIFSVYEMSAADDFSIGSVGGIVMISSVAMMFVLAIVLYIIRLKINVKYDSLNVGMFKGRTTPMEDIHSVAVEDFSPMKDYMGWGLRVGRKGFGYIAAGTNKGLRINLKTGKSYFISSKRAYEFESAMNTALKAKRNAERP